MQSLNYEWSMTSGCKDICIEMRVCGEFFSDNQKTVEKEDNIIAILYCMHLMLLQSKYSITRHLLNHCFIELSLFTLHNCFVLCSMDFLKL